MELLEKLISIPSHGVGNPDREKDMAKYLKNYVTEKFPAMEIIVVTKSGYTNLLCLGSRSPKILLACHMDTVPPSRENHTNLEIKGDRAYGLGTKDMKGGIVSSLLSLEDIDNKKDVGIVFYSDEEYTQQGIIVTAEIIPKYLENQPKIVISPESRFNIGYGARGIISINVEVGGKKAHSARPHLGNDAIFGFFESVFALREALEKETNLGETTTILTSIEGGLMGSDGAMTSHPGSIPDYVKAHISIRNSQVKLNSQNVLDIFEKELKTRKLKLISYDVDADHGARYVEKNIVSDMVSLAKVKLGYDIELGDPKLAGYNDAELLGKALKCPVINFGPTGDANHTADEWVSIESIEQVAKVFSLWVKNADTIL